MLLAVSAAALVIAQGDKLDFAMLGRIRDEGLNRSQVMDHVSWLSDVYGPRLTGSPAIQQASEWTMKTFREWGLANVHQERWRFGKGWSLVRFSAHLVEPQIQPLIGFPQEWSSGTKGPVTAEVVRVQIANEADFDRYVANSPAESLAQRRARCGCSRADHPAHDRAGHQSRRRRRCRRQPAAPQRQAAALRQKVADFYVREGVRPSSIAALTATWRRAASVVATAASDGGTIFPSGSGPATQGGQERAGDRAAVETATG
jgi:hypothetical protein